FGRRRHWRRLQPRAHSSRQSPRLLRPRRTRHPPNLFVEATFRWPPAHDVLALATYPVPARRHLCDNNLSMVSQFTIPATVPGRFGPYGGRYVPETLMVPLLELERSYEVATSDPEFQARFNDLLKNFAGRPTPFQLAS